MSTLYSVWVKGLPLESTDDDIKDYIKDWVTSVDIDTNSMRINRCYNIEKHVSLVRKITKLEEHIERLQKDEQIKAKSSVKNKWWGREEPEEKPHKRCYIPFICPRPLTIDQATEWMNKLKAELDEEKWEMWENKNQKYLGSVIITFEMMKEREAMLWKYHRGVIATMFAFIQRLIFSVNEDKIMAARLQVMPAPGPTEINW